MTFGPIFIILVSDEIRVSSAFSSLASLSLSPSSTVHSDRMNSSTLLALFTQSFPTRRFPVALHVASDIGIRQRGMFSLALLFLLFFVGVGLL